MRKVLENGIALPDEWPPRYEENLCGMKVPYLKHKPEVIPINRGRQLFVDDFLIAETDLKRTCHNPIYYEKNPVLEVDEDWEYTVEGYPYAAPFSDGVWYDDLDQKFKMWYLAGAGKINQEKHSLCTCYAESQDGIHWIKPKLDVVPGTNIVEVTNRDSSTVWIDREEKDPAKRYKLFNVEYKNDYIQWQYVLKYSGDGIHWSQGIAQSGAVSDRSTAFYNPFLKKWVLSMRHHNSVSWRSRTYLEHDDPEEAVSLAHRIREGTRDKHIHFWFNPDKKEKRHTDYPDTEPGIYSFDVVAYESLMLGIYSQWQGPENDVCRSLMMPKRNEIQLGYSRDGFHFFRPTYESFMEVDTSHYENWNYGNMQAVGGMPLVVQDKLYFYSSGRKRNGIWWDSGTSCGLAVLRRDGFVSLNAETEGTLLTETLTFDGSYFFVNAKVEEKLEVEILDEAGYVIPGYERENCIPLSGDHTRGRIVWKQNDSVEKLKERKIKIKIYLKKGELYAFWISPWTTGESRGYLTGGGPGLSGTGQDIPR